MIILYPRQKHKIYPKKSFFSYISLNYKNTLLLMKYTLGILMIS